MKAPGATVALVGVAALTLAGCGDGRLSHGDFVRRADAVCSAYDAKTPVLERPGSYAAVVDWVDTTLPLYVSALDKLRALRPPADDDAGVRAWLAENAKVAIALRALRGAAMERDPAGTNSQSTAVQATGLASERAAAALGLTVCSAP